ncbi:MAG: Eco57I restriction-modification methylase domain-containing protein [Proteobacteria bacterium]|nr:Eco57I restriction-modification methylase domain-containing protein [Pseudomonadota bacterium]
MLAPRALQKLSRELAELASSERGSADTERERRCRRVQGAYFTPPPLVAFVVAETLNTRLADPGLRWRADGSPALRVLDPSAGDGRFLAAAIELLVDRAIKRGGDRARVREAIARRCVVGLERDPEFAALARARLGTSAPIYCCEALLDAPADAAQVDAVVGNPPYLRSIRFSRSDHSLWQTLRGRYAATSHGEWDLYAAFIEQSLDWIRPGGEIGLVVPSRWLTAAFAIRLREKLARESAVRALIDFGHSQIFAGATTYASVVFLSHKSSREITVARYSDTGWTCGQLSATSLSGQPWRLAVGEQRALIEHVSGRGPTLGDVARIVKGAGTNADPVYVLDNAEIHGHIVRGQCKAAGAGEWIEIESAACRPCLRGRDVARYRSATSQVYCIVPYQLDGSLWSPERLAEHPRARAHLERFRPRLEARESGRHAGDHYYRFGRPQNMAFLGTQQAKIVVPDVARDGRAILDKSGAMVLDSAYAIRLRQNAAYYSLRLLVAILNSPMVGWWLRQTGIPLRGGYVRLKTAYLTTLPLPPINPDSDQLIDRITRISTAIAARQTIQGDTCQGRESRLEASLADLIRRTYAIEPDTWRTLVVPDSA